VYTDKNYQTKKQLIEDVKAGKQVSVYPQPHKWYASATIQNGIIIKVK
jgi:hypothetical protein